jgi:RNA polymerase sigma-70 factor (ECF subfamily)
MASKSFLGLSQRRAFKKLLANSRDRLYRMAYAWTHDPQLADDLVQQSICKAISNQKQLKDIGAAEAWLFRIMSNCLKDHYRARREVLSSEELVIVDTRTPEQGAEELQLVIKVRQAVRKLPTTQCQVITLVDLEGFTYATVAEILEIPVGTVMSRLCRGRRALKESLVNIRPRQQFEEAASLKRIK